MSTAPAHDRQPETTAASGGVQGAVLLVSSGTALSRFTGLIRDIVIFTWLGISPSMDALVLALRIPGTFYRFVVDAGFIRLLVPRLIQSPDRGLYTAATFLPSTLVVTLATLLLWLVSPGLVALMAPGFDAPQRELATELIRVVVFYIPLAFVTGYLAALLNSSLRYGTPAYIQVVLNLSVACGTAAFALYFEQPHLVVVLSMLGGGLLQILVLLFPLWRLRILPKLRPVMTSPAFVALLSGLGLMLLVTLPQQLGMWISFALGSQVEAGAPSRLYLAERIIQLPLAVIGIALATVVLPVFSRLEKEGRADDFARMLDWGLRIGMLFALPALVGLSLIGDQLLQMLFGWRQIDSAEIAEIAVVMYAMLPTVPFAVMVQLMGAGYFSRQSYRTPILSSLAGMLALGAGAWYLGIALGHGGVGIGLGNSLGAAVAALCMAVLQIWGGYWRIAIGSWALFLFRVTLGCALMGFCVWQMGLQLVDSLPLPVLVLLECAVAVPLYFGALRLLGMRPSDWYRAPVTVGRN